MLKFPISKVPTEELTDYYNRVHFWAQQHFQWTPDLEVWGLPDYWATIGDIQLNADINHNILKGDCDDFAQLVRYVLAESGIDSRLVLCYVENGGYHCVTETNEGYVFDCRQPRLTQWEYLKAMGYKKDIMGPICNPNEPYLKDRGDWHQAL